MSIKAKKVLRSIYNWVKETHNLTPVEKDAYKKLLIALGNDLKDKIPGTINEIIDFGNHLIDKKLNNIKNVFDTEIIKIERNCDTQK